MTLNINLTQDWIDLLKRNLKESGYNTSNVEDQKIPALYYDLKIRLIEIKPRKLKVSKEFHCPKNIEKGWDILKHNIESGKNLNIHLSRGIKYLKNGDGLLNSWGIYHFHLGEGLRKDGFIERTGPLVFALVRDDTVYVIDIYNHGDWYKQDIVQIMHDNWSEVIQEYQAPGIAGDYYTEMDVEELRNSNMNHCITVNDGTVYFPIGGGSSCSGVNTYASIFSKKMNRVLKKLEKDISADLEEKIGSHEIDVKLCIANGRYIIKSKVRDSTCNIVIDDFDVHQYITCV